jgi:hypothetical protein
MLILSVSIPCSFKLRYNRVNILTYLSFLKEVSDMGIILILGVMVTFLAAIFTSGYDDKPIK